MYFYKELQCKYNISYWFLLVYSQTASRSFTSRKRVSIGIETENGMNHRCQSAFSLVTGNTLTSAPGWPLVHPAQTCSWEASVRRTKEGSRKYWAVRVSKVSCDVVMDSNLNVKHVIWWLTRLGIRWRKSSRKEQMTESHTRQRDRNQSRIKI